MPNETTNNVKIKLVSSITPLEGDVETYEMWLQGAFIEKAGSPYLRYEEVQEEQSIMTTIKLASEKALILRSGAVKMRLPLNIDQLEAGHYKNALGEIPIGIQTNTLNFDGAQKSGQFTANYDLLIDGNSVGNYVLEIHYQEV
jgi:uncharacterized beta-barrel protein YwiB (DUF1934 family)